jgi:hypothetical protein
MGYVLLSFITTQDIAMPINSFRLKIKKDVAHIGIIII